MKFTEIEVGTGFAGDRTARIYVKTKNLRASGVFIPSFGTKMTIRPGAGGDPRHPGSCVAKMDTGRTYTDNIGAWGDKFLVYEVSSPEAKADTTRIDKVAACTFQTHYKVDGNRGASPWSNGPDGGLRFDSAAYINPYGKQGAVFDRITPVMRYSRTDAAVKGVAEHVYDAIYAPQLTYPQKNDKDIPGNIWNGEWQPLHRNYRKFNAESKKTSAQNRTAKNAACAGLTNGQDEQCDEFPFASTKEGAGKGDGNFSVRYVPQADNSAAGSRLSQWYGQDRILDGDAYGMSVDRPTLRGLPSPARPLRRGSRHRDEEEVIRLQPGDRVLVAHQLAEAGCGRGASGTEHPQPITAVGGKREGELGPVDGAHHQISATAVVVPFAQPSNSAPRGSDKSGPAASVTSASCSCASLRTSTAL
ncbi:NucA/NucB deoxyribonuclease domain-containing protein [Streptomyces sp. SAS_270]|uniref:NucA/NucB deoxyribonuclease domain-containing protein n=1 Tax=Streptomyces sp. SAS_270 TaxID=3412748 RepID=UPI00403D32F8